jgi:hypothetical protein
MQKIAIRKIRGFLKQQQGRGGHYHATPMQAK